MLELNNSGLIRPILHLYSQPQWSKSKNKAEFGLCYSQFGHGHNYILKVIVPDSKEILKTRDQIRKIVDLVDHKHLNFEVEEFKNQIPTSEMIVQFFEEKLRSQKPLKIVLFEDEFLGAEWTN
jgi:6-pyruvoyltetrahydropterin/6-carboxytetrahydropterin synthase